MKSVPIIVLAALLPIHPAHSIGTTIPGRAAADYRQDKSPSDLDAQRAFAVDWFSPAQPAYLRQVEMLRGIALP
jgi:hypothetical protein